MVRGRYRPRIDHPLSEIGVSPVLGRRGELARRVLAHGEAAEGLFAARWTSGEDLVFQTQADGVAAIRKRSFGCLGCYSMRLSVAWWTSGEDLVFQTQANETPAVVKRSPGCLGFYSMRLIAAWLTFSEDSVFQTDVDEIAATRKRSPGCLGCYSMRLFAAWLTFWEDLVFQTQAYEVAAIVKGGLRSLVYYPMTHLNLSSALSVIVFFFPLQA